VKEKSVILFIVEGANDEVALGAALTNLQKKQSPDKLVHIGITHGDITSDFKTKNVEKVLSQHIEAYRAGYKLRKKDFCKIVLLVDMDGAYVPATAIVESSEHENAFYTESEILHKEPLKLQKTHEHKQRNINTLLTLSHVFDGIPFSMYFVSCNLDHIIDGNANLTNREKNAAADSFADRCGDKPQEFLSFFNNPELVLGHEYNETWHIIRQDNNSLKRCSNLNVFFHSGF
jgi:hypothetical protein